MSELFSPEEAEQIKELRRKGYTWDKISKKVGRPFTTIYEHFAPPTVITPNQRSEVLKQRRQGISWRIIGEQFGVDEETIRNRIRKCKQTSKQKAHRKTVQKELKQKKLPNPDRKKPRIVHSVEVSVEALAERDRRLAVINRQLTIERLMGDPPPGFSALARLTAEQKGRLK